MTQMSSYPNGTFSWVELSAADPEAAKTFYSELFGWEHEDTPLPGGAVYTMSRKDGHYVGAIQTLQDEMRAQGHPPFWLSYVSVEDVDAVAARVADLGGTLMAPPFDVMDAGRMAVVMDPRKATLALWQAKEHPGAGLVNEPGSLCWNELATDDVDAARDFYSNLLGWTPQAQDMGGMDYTVFHAGETPVAGMTKLNADMGPMPPNWSVSFAVADVDESAARIKDLGGNLLMPPTDFPGGRFAVATDSQGAFFGIVKMDASPE